jgi:hypothetical protein
MCPELTSGGNSSVDFINDQVNSHFFSPFPELVSIVG